MQHLEILVSQIAKRKHSNDNLSNNGPTNKMAT
jgi:hypothetical protein